MRTSRGRWHWWTGCKSGALGACKLNGVRLVQSGAHARARACVPHGVFGEVVAVR